jgi:hypothetical protein
VAAKATEYSFSLEEGDGNSLRKVDNTAKIAKIFVITNNGAYIAWVSKLS